MTMHDRCSNNGSRGLTDSSVAVGAWFLLLLLAMFTVAPLAAQGHGDDEHAAQPVERTEHAADALSQDPAHGDPSHGGGHSAQSGGHGAHDLPPLMEMETGAIFDSFFVHLVPHEVFAPKISPDENINRYVVFYDVNLYQVFAAFLLFAIFLPTLASFGNPKPAPFLRVMRGWCLWIRDDVVYPIMGPVEGRKWLPGFLFVFFFIAVGNVLGLIPNSVTSTATIFVTGALASVTFVTMLVGGMMTQGVGAYFKNLVPHGVPVAMVPLLFPLELIGLLVKPVALAIRLFANMLAGHLVLYSFLGLIFLFAQMVEKSWLSFPLAIPGFGLAVFIYIIESFVALLQAYIFTLLSCIFIQQALHPDH